MSRSILPVMLLPSINAIVIFPVVGVTTVEAICVRELFKKSVIAVVSMVADACKHVRRVWLCN